MRPTSGYHLADGTRCPGVTSCEPSQPGLIWWAGSTGYDAGYEDGLAGADRRTWPEVRQATAGKAADAGTLAHLLFERYLRGVNEPPMELEEADADVRAAAENSYDNARGWLEHSGLHVEPLERWLVSERYRYGGTPDAVLVSPDGSAHVGDWKSGGVYTSSVVQVSAYRQLLREAGAGHKTSGAHIVRFPREGGGYTHRFLDAATLDKAWELFLLWRRGYDLTRELDRVARA